MIPLKGLGGFLDEALFGHKGERRCIWDNKLP